MLNKGVTTCYLNLLVISPSCFDTKLKINRNVPHDTPLPIAKLITNGHYTFKQLSESVAQIM